MRTLMVAVALLAAAAVWADDYGWHPASLDIGGQHVLTIRVGAGTFSTADRRAMLEFRMTRALTHTEYLKAVNMDYRRVPGGMAIYSNSIYFMTVTREDARACNSTVPALAKQWGRSIKRTFEIVGPARQLPHEDASRPKAPIALD